MAVHGFLYPLNMVPPVDFTVQYCWAVGSGNTHTHLVAMPDKLARLLCRLRLDPRQLRLELFRLAGGSSKLYRGASVLLSPAPVSCRQLRLQSRHLKSAAPHTTRNDTARHDNNASVAPLESRYRWCTMPPLRPLQARWYVRGCHAPSGRPSNPLVLPTFSTVVDTHITPFGGKTTDRMAQDRGKKY